MANFNFDRRKSRLAWTVTQTLGIPPVERDHQLPIAKQGLLVSTATQPTSAMFFKPQA